MAAKCILCKAVLSDRENCTWPTGFCQKCVDASDEAKRKDPKLRPGLPLSALRDQLGPDPSLY